MDLPELRDVMLIIKNHKFEEMPIQEKVSKRGYSMVSANREIFKTIQLKGLNEFLVECREHFEKFKKGIIESSFEVDLLKYFERRNIQKNERERILLSIKESNSALANKFEPLIESAFKSLNKENPNIVEVIESVRILGYVYTNNVSFLGSMRSMDKADFFLFLLVFYDMKKVELKPETILSIQRDIKKEPLYLDGIKIYYPKIIIKTPRIYNKASVETFTIDEIIELGYDDYVEYLKDRYGKVQKDYFVNENFKSTSSESRSAEGLERHHIREDIFPKLSDAKVAKHVSWEFQKAENLIWCNKVEHAILHLLIFLKTNNKGLGLPGLFHYIMPTIHHIFMTPYDLLSTSEQKSHKNILEPSYSSLYIGFLSKVICFMNEYERKKVKIDEIIKHFNLNT
ncbi:MAG: hypothetical protein FWF50_06055 [Defluviitaleaceae bacterium]|nr:hypothetical protein [Defluviitaleaceae bacterium]